MAKNKSSLLIKIHIVILIIGSLFLLSGAFQSNIWFDEAYSAALTRHSLPELISIAYQDVHPFLYYVFLYLFTYAAGGGIIAARIFSVFGGIVLALIGFTHIRRYFGERTGFYFSLFAFIFASTFKFAIEIRMYIWAAVFVTFAALYAWLCVKNDFKAHDMSLFIAFSLFSAYFHYYGLISVCMINAMMLISLIINKFKKLRSYLLCAALQLIFYIPGFIVFINQTASVAQGDYWIRVKYPDTIVQTIYYPFVGDVFKDTLMPDKLILLIAVIAAAVYAAAIIKTVAMFRRDKKTAMPVLAAEIMYIGIISAALAASVWKDIFYVRYIMVLHGILLFIGAYLFSHIKYRRTCAVILSCVIIMFAVRVPYMYKDIYSDKNFALNKAVDRQIEEDDIIIYNDIMIGSVLSLRYPDNRQYLVKSGMEDYPRAYLAFAPVMKTVCDTDEIDDFNGRVWVFDTKDGEDSMIQLILEKYDKAEIISGREFADETYRRIYFIYYLAEIK